MITGYSLLINLLVLVIKNCKRRYRPRPNGLVLTGHQRNKSDSGVLPVKSESQQALLFLLTFSWSWR